MLKPKYPTAVGKRIIAEMLHRICEDLSKQVTLLDDLDRVVGDGDCGECTF